MGSHRKISTFTAAKTALFAFFALLLLAAALWLTFDCVIFFFLGDGASMGRLLGYVAFAIRWILWKFGHWSIGNTGEVIVVSILTVFAAMVARIYLGDVISVCRKTIGKSIISVDIAVSLISQICKLPWIGIGMLAKNLFSLAMMILFSMFTTPGFGKKVQVFVSESPLSNIIWIAFLVLLYLISFKHKVLDPIRHNPLRKGKKTTLGSDGNTYTLPTSYQVGLRYLGSFDQVTDARDFMAAFQNELHYLLWLSETTDLAYKIVTRNFNAVLEVKDPGKKGYAQDTILNGRVMWNDFYKLCATASDAWADTYRDIPRAVHYQDIMTDVALRIAGEGEWPSRGNVTSTNVKEAYRFLIAYEKDAKKQKEYEDRLEAFSHAISGAISAQDKAVMDALTAKADKAQAAGSSTPPYLADSSQPDHMGNTVDQLPPVISRDGYSYQRVTGVGSYPAQYHCSQNGETVYIFRAEIRSYGADTDCGTFYF